jgi:hypothetical protein
MQVQYESKASKEARSARSERPGLFASGGTGLLGCADGGEDRVVLAVEVLVNLGPDLDDLAGGGDEEGLAGGELHDAVVLDGDAVGIDDFVVRIGEELEGEALLGAEALVAVRGVEGDAENDGVGGLELIKIGLEVVGFAGASLGLVLGVEVEDDPLALVFVEGDGGVVLRGKGEVGGACADGQVFGVGQDGGDEEGRGEEECG